MCVIFFSTLQITLLIQKKGDVLMADNDPEASSLTNSEDEERRDDEKKRIAHYLLMLSDDNPASRWKAAESLGRLKDPRATEPLIDALFDEDARVRMKVAWALGSIGEDRALAPLRQLYRIENEGNREIIEAAISTITRHMSGQ
jgi:HEAT repeat protein